MTHSSILWRRLDLPGHEAARLDSDDSLWRLSGTAVFAYQQQSCRLDYRILCDASWRTSSARVAGWVGADQIVIEIAADADGRWRVNGADAAQVSGCIDLDLNFSPSTNLLPIRRLALEVGQEAVVRAAWLRFPSFRLEPLEQLYRRTADRAYRYESGGGRFTADLEVDATGFVLRYAGVWESER
ncbi:MAG TPA: putative glycolipid-binding domain-containing protein [Thermoanaerobaculia bacterium]|nr:putative glycolipid-binding domain-containing protein [Thermoanaerobaculia bacterium]